MKKIVLTIITIGIFLLGKAQSNELADAYINQFKAIAIAEMQRTGVPAAIKLAQGIYESAYGQSNLVKRSNNHFGIKCKTGYTGPYVLHDDDRRNERFVKYEDARQSYIDHSDFLKNRPYYTALFDLDPRDYKAWATGLKKAGYATNPKYAQMIISLVERYDLQKYSLMALGEMSIPEEVQKEIISQKNTLQHSK